MTEVMQRAPSRTRLAGVDAARGLAVLGMIVTHVAATAAASGPGGTVFHLAEGRSAILFGVLAGVSLGLLSGGASGLVERPRGARTRIAVRAAILFVLGIALAAVSTGPMVILSYYAVMFVVALPFLWVRPGALLAWAAGWALVAPQVSFVLRGTIEQRTLGGAVGPSDLTSWSAAGDAGLRLLLTGAYPVATWMPFVLAGLAVGRLDLRATVVRTRLLAAGVGAAVLGYGGSWLALHVFGGQEALLVALGPLVDHLHVAPQQALELVQSSSLGTTGTLTPAFLLVDAAHSGTTFEIIGSAGVAVAVLAALSTVGDRMIVAPLAAVGGLAASIYAAHIVALALLTAAAPDWQISPWPATVAFLVTAVVIATAWRRMVGRGPVEWVLHTLSTRAASRA